MDLASERGLARPGTATRVAIALVIAAVITFDLSAIVVNIFQLDELANRAAQSAAGAWRDAPTAAVVETAVEDEVAAVDNVQIERIAVDNATVWVTLRRPPPVLVLDKVPPVRRRIDMSITQEATLDPQGL